MGWGISRMVVIIVAQHFTWHSMDFSMEYAMEYSMEYSLQFMECFMEPRNTSWNMSWNILCDEFWKVHAMFCWILNERMSTPLSVSWNTLWNRDVYGMEYRKCV